MAKDTKTTARPQQQTTAQPAPNGNAPAVQDQQPQRQPTAVEEAVIKRRQRLARFGEFLVERQQTLLECLPDEINPQKFISVVKTALASKPDLIDCTFESLWNACVRAAQMGLMPDGKEGAIAPYGDMGGGAKANIATFMPMIEGYRKLARNAGILDWRVGLVYAKDDFDFEEGDNPRLHHRRYFGADDPGALVGGYSIAKLPDGTISREIMTIREMNAIRSVSKAKNGPWSRPEFNGEMYKKTVARRHFKILPKSSNDQLLARAIEHDDHEFGPKFGDVETQLAAPVAHRIAATPADRLAAFAGESAGPVDAAGGAVDHDQTTGEVTGEEDFGQAGGDREPAGEAEARASSMPKKDPPANGQKGTTQATKPKTDKDAGAAGGNATASKPAAVEAEPLKNPKPTDDPEMTFDELTGGGSGPDADAADGIDPISGLSGGDAALEALDDDFPGDKTDAPADPKAPGGAWERRWDAGEEPTTEEEYRHYMPYVLRLNVKRAGEVAPWFRADDQVAIRKVCGCDKDPVFTELQHVAVAYRKELGKAESDAAAASGQ